MKTTNQEFKVQVQSHIKDCLCEDYNDQENLSLQDQLKNVVIEFNNYYSKYEQKMQPNKNLAFQEFLNGLPTVLSVEYSNFERSHLIQTWFETVGDQYKERSADKESDLYLHLITREFITLCKKNNVQF